MRAVGRYLRANVLGAIAIFIALGGSSYAAIAIPRGSVGTAQLRNGAVTPAKLNGREIGGSVRAWAYVSAAGHEYVGRGFTHVGRDRDIASLYRMNAKKRDLRRCAVTASVVVDNHVGGPPYVGYATAEPPFPAGTTKNSTIYVRTYGPVGQPTPQPFVVELLC